MLNIVKSLLFRLKKTKMFWIMLGVCAFLPVLVSLLYHFMLDIVDIFVDIPLDAGMEAATHLSLTSLVSLSSDVNLFVLLCVSIFLCKEFTDGTIRNTLLSNKSRWQLYSAYGVTSLIIGGSYLLAYFVSTLLALGIPFGFGDVTPNQAISACLCSLLLGVLSMLLVVSCVLLFLFLTGKQAPSIVLPILVTMFLPSIAASAVELVSTLVMLVQMGGQWMDVNIDYSWVPLYNAFMYDSMNVEGALVAKISMYYVAFTGLFVWLGSLSARKRDLK
jgi:ABC-type transport system involved in multi-copper enzyme maturation permease subunit